MSYFYGGPEIDVRQFVKEFDKLSGIELHDLFSREKCQVYSDLLKRSPGVAVDVMLDQTIEWAKLFESRIRACSAVIGHVNETYDLGADPHLSGVPILVVTENGHYVYKPRPVDLDHSYNLLVEVLIGCGLKFAPGALLVHKMPGYGFVKFVNSRPSPVTLCEQDFQKIGTALAIVYALAGTDFHYENIVFADGGLFLIDQEGLLQPTPTKNEIVETDSISVLNTGILPLRITVGDRFDFDPSVFGSKRFAFSCSQETAMWAFLQGFIDAYDCIYSNRHSLVHEPAYQAMSESYSRYIPCQTVDYYRAMARHIRSLPCTDSSLQSNFLHSMSSSEGPDDPFLHSEKEALSRFCIPLFYHSNKDSRIVSEDGKSVSVLLSRSGFESSLARITSGMSSRDMRRQAWFIKSAFELHALNSGLKMDIVDDCCWFAHVGMPLFGLVTDLLARVSDYLKIDDLSRRYAVVPVFEGEHWRLRNRRLDDQACGVYVTVEGLVENMERYFESNSSETLDICETGIRSAIEGIYLQAPTEKGIAGFSIVDEPQFSENILISLEAGPCSSILEAFSDREGRDCLRCLEFVSSLKLAQERGKIRYGGVFSVHCLYISFGLPLLITTLCASLLTLFRDGDEVMRSTIAGPISNLEAPMC